MTSQCPSRKETCPESCPGPINADIKFQGQHTADTQICRETYLRVRSMPGVRVEVLTAGVIIDTDGFAIDSLL